MNVDWVGGGYVRGCQDGTFWILKICWGGETGRRGRRGGRRCICIRARGREKSVIARERDVK